MASQHIIDINLNDNLQDVIRKANYNFKVTNASALRNTKNSVRNVTVDVDQEINAINNAIEVVSNGLADETTARQNADTALDNQINAFDSQLDAKIASAVSSAVATAVANAMLAKFPPGCIYITATNINPGTFIGGTWQAVGAGYTLVGAGTGTDANNVSKSFSAGATGGEYNHTLTEAQMPNHAHAMAASVNGNINNTASNSGTAYLASYSTTPNTDLPYSFRGTITAANKWSTGFKGSGDAFNVMQPYLVVYFWKRIS